MQAQSGIPFHLWRGGTSKGVFFDRAVVPADRDELAAFLLNVFGSPDPRQIDGLGGGDKLTSKAAILGPSSSPDADVDYLFAQVGINHAEVDFKLNCGNLSAAVATHAIEQGYVPITDGHTTVRINNLNTGRIIHARVPVSHGRVVYTGDLAIDGVPGAGAPIELDFREATGSLTGALLPLGEARTRLDVAGLGPTHVSVIDGANLVVLVAAEDLGMQGSESPREIDGNAPLVARIQAIRGEVAHRLGMGEYWQSRAAPSNPMLVAVQSPRSYLASNGRDAIQADSIDLLCRQYSTGATSKALAATVTATIGMACRIPGSVAARFLRPGGAVADPIRIGHPAGRIMVRASVRADAGTTIEQAAIQRTARIIARGEVFMRPAC